MSIASDMAAILAALGSISGIKTVEEFAGDLDAMFRDSSPRPALYLVYAGGAYGEQEILGTPVQLAPARRVWTVLVAVYGRKSPGITGAEAVVIVDAVIAALKGLKIGNNHVWPLSDEFLKAKNGVLVYGVDFVIESEE